MLSQHILSNPSYLACPLLSTLKQTGCALLCVLAVTDNDCVVNIVAEMDRTKVISEESVELVDEEELSTQMADGSGQIDSPDPGGKRKTPIKSHSCFSPDYFFSYLLCLNYTLHLFYSALQLQ